MANQEAHSDEVTKECPGCGAVAIEAPALDKKAKLENADACPVEKIVPNGDPLCDDLARFSCAPGEYNDGTGVARTPSAINDATRDHQKVLIPKFIEKFQNELKKPENSYFRKLAISALGLAYSPDWKLRRQNTPLSPENRYQVHHAGRTQFGHDRETKSGVG